MICRFFLPIHPFRGHFPAQSCSGLQAISGLHSSLQTSVFSKVKLSLKCMVPEVPEDMLPALVQRHVSAGTLDISGQLGAGPLTQPSIASVNGETNNVQLSSAAKLPLIKVLSVLSSIPNVSVIDVSRNGLFKDGSEHNLPSLAALIRSHALSLVSLALSEPSEQPCVSSDKELGSMPLAALSRPCSPDTDMVWESVSQCSALTKLKLQNQRFHPSYGQNSILESLLKLSSLAELDVSGSFGYTIPPVMPRLVSSLTNLTALSLANSSLFAGRNDGLQICTLRAISRLSDLQSLDISDNQCGLSQYLGALAAAAFMPSMRSFRTERMGVVLSPQFQAVSVDEFLEIHRSVLSCGAGGVDPVDSSQQHSQEPVSGSAGSSREGSAANLTSLNVHTFASTSKAARVVLGCMSTQFECGLGPEDGQPVFCPATPGSVHAWSLLRSLENVKTLDFSGVPIGHGADKDDCLAKFVVGLSSLRELDLSDCMLPSSCLVHLCETLRKYTAEGQVVGITSLDWSNNQKFLRANVMSAICGVKTLRRLVLQNNGLSCQQVGPQLHLLWLFVMSVTCSIVVCCEQADTFGVSSCHCCSSIF